MDSFASVIARHEWENVSSLIDTAVDADVTSAIAGEGTAPERIAALLSAAADRRLEELAREANRITRMRFGNVMQLYAPLYLSNECTNTCRYCGFNVQNPVARLTLSLDQALAEARAIRAAGFRHVLLLTGEDRRAMPVTRLADTVRALHEIFSSLSIEVYPMDTGEYAALAAAGVDGLTLYQETYHAPTYAAMHPAGRKRDYRNRIEAPDRGGAAGLRRIGVGALLGLAPWRCEGFFTALHAAWLARRYWRSMISISFPRIREAPGGFVPPCPVSDRDLVHLICVMRILLPDAGLLLSTREPAALRDHIAPLGITMMSAGSRTEPGGYTGVGKAAEQFSIEDRRSPAEIAAALSAMGFDPVWKDWDREFTAASPR